MNRSRKELFGCTNEIILSGYLSIPDEFRDIKTKCRVTYSVEIENIEYERYADKKIKLLKMVFDDAIDYRYKFRNRESLENLRALRGTADEILIIKNGKITDTSFTNIVFLKEGEWFTPEFPLLKGTRREDYLRTNRIREKIIRPGELYQYEEARLINSMRSLEESEPIETSNIY
jgi:4-amino-4-deoxychorismate lyase